MNGHERDAVRRGTNLVQVAGFNDSVILDAVRRAPDGVSRVELTAVSGLSAQTVSNITRRLIARGFIAESGTHSVTGNGKPRRLLRLRPEGRFAIGAFIDPVRVSVVMLDLAATTVARRERPAPASGDPSEMVRLIQGEVELLVQESRVDRDRILGLGVAAPGPIDVTHRDVLAPIHLKQWGRVPLRDRLATSLDMPVVLDKDVIAAAIAERWAGATQHTGNFVFFFIGTGIGVGLVSHDTVVRGAYGDAGDIGLMPLFGAAPDTGARRLHDATVPEAMIAAAVAAGVRLPNGRPRSALEIEQGLHALVARADDGDSAALGIIAVAARAIGEVSAHLANLLDCDTVVLGGTYWDLLEHHYLPVVRAQVAGSRMYPDLHPTAVTSTALGADVGAIGAGCLVLDSLVAPKTDSLPLRVQPG